MTPAKSFTARQLLFKEMVVGTLIYAVVLGFFNDYTDIFKTESFSRIFLAAVVMQILTYLTFLLKGHAIAWLKGREGPLYKIAMFFCVWLIMFLSKFVFLYVIEVLFGNDITVSGFIGIFVIIICVTILHKLADYAFKRLGKS